MDDHRLPAMVETVPDAVAWWAERTPEAPALFSGDDAVPPLSYVALHHQVAVLAERLTTAGIGRGDTVAIQTDRRAGSVVAIVAAMHAGVALPLAPGAGEAELAAIFARLAPALLVADDGDSPLLRAARAANVPVVLPSGNGTDNYGVWSTPAPSGETCLPDDLALILQSSGTTGHPRGIPRTNRNLLAAAAAYAAWVEQDAFARALVTTPLSYGMGAHSLVATLCAGGAIVLPGGAPGAILAAVERWQPTWAYVVPALLEEILREAGLTGRRATSDWRGIGVAGMAPSPTLAARVETTFGAPLAEGYGCGEAGLIAGTTDGQERSPGLLQEIYARGFATVDEEGFPAVAGESGEIVVWGPQVSAAYLGDAEATTAAFLPDGRFRTGDVGVLDHAGRLRLTGRVKDIINRGGEKLSPAEIDAALAEHPAVAEAAAFSIPDGRLGEEAAAAVVLHPGAVVSERDLRRHAAKHLAPAKVPRRIWVVDALPRTGTGKVRRGELAQQYGSGGDARGR